MTGLCVQHGLCMDATPGFWMSIASVSSFRNSGAGSRFWPINGRRGLSSSRKPALVFSCFRICASAAHTTFEGLCRKMIRQRDAPWIAELQREVSLFPNGKHDDQVDSLTQFLRWFAEPRLMPRIRAL